MTGKAKPNQMFLHKKTRVWRMEQIACQRKSSHTDQLTHEKQQANGVVFYLWRANQTIPHWKAKPVHFSYIAWALLMKNNEFGISFLRVQRWSCVRSEYDPPFKSNPHPISLCDSFKIEKQTPRWKNLKYNTQIVSLFISDLRKTKAKPLSHCF